MSPNREMIKLQNFYLCHYKKSLKILRQKCKIEKRKKNVHKIYDQLMLFSQSQTAGDMNEKVFETIKYCRLELSYNCFFYDFVPVFWKEFDFFLSLFLDSSKKKFDLSIQKLHKT